MKDPTDVQATEAAREREARSRRRRLEIWRASLRRGMSSENGREFMAAVIEFCRVNAQSAVPGDSHETYFNEGRRSVGLWLTNEIQDHCRDLWVVMQREHMDRAAALRLAEEENE